MTITSPALTRLLLGLALGFTAGAAHASDCPSSLSGPISIDAPAELRSNSITRIAIEDTVRLLQQAFPRSQVGTQLESAQIRIRLPEVEAGADARPSRFTQALPYANLNYPDHDYSWNARCENGVAVLDASSPSHPGVSFALYGLLQDKLGFHFVHPRQTVIPKYSAWPLSAEWTYAARPRFDKKGYHLHTMHPIELTDAFLDAKSRTGIADIRAYIDWLVRNQQNAVQFVLLRTIDAKKWPKYANQFIAYGKSRGVLMGINITLAMFQQKAWRAVNMLRLPGTYESQLKKSMDWLEQTDWDYVGVDFATGEYFPDVKSQTDPLRAALAKEITENHRWRLFHKVHVIPEGIIPEVEQNSGIQVHSTMCYSITEPKAPVYGFENQRFVLDRLKEEIKQRETWYFPESAYWVTFDNDVPMLLLPYLDSRWSDIHTVADVGVNSHITFSSGWEWGYWLIDWSIARWTWERSENGKPVADSPLSTYGELFGAHSEATHLMNEALALQNRFLKDKELLRYLPPSTPMDEALGAFIKPFQPTPPFRYSQLMRADKALAAKVESTALAPMRAYADAVEELSSRWLAAVRSAARGNPVLTALGEELVQGFEISGLRARHRSLTMAAILANHAPVLPYLPKSRAKELLREAAVVREKAQQIVNARERGYRYPVEKLAGKYTDFTAYHWGYLYPVHKLHFWKREEDQVRSTRFDAFYENIWSFNRILGIEL